MPSYNIEVNFEFDITCTCDECGEELKVREKVVGGTSTYRVEPCETCFRHEREEAHKKGFESGEEFGYTKGHMAGYTEGQDSMEPKDPM